MAEPALTLEIVEQAGDWSGFDAEALLRDVPGAVAARAPAVGLATVVLADDATLRDLNSRFRGKDKPTNVLSFPAGTQLVPGEEPYLGDIVVSRETLLREAEDEGKSPPHHFIHLVTHGILHLLGHDHIDEHDAIRMETLEVEILVKLGLSDPYAETASAL